MPCKVGASTVLQKLRLFYPVSRNDKGVTVVRSYFANCDSYSCTSCKNRI